MVRVWKRIIPFGFVFCLLAVLVSSISFDPPQAVAKPVPTGGSNWDPYGSGDPTGDDVPSPTPKPTAPQAGPAPQVSIAPSSHASIVRGGAASHNRWSVYLSILIRLGLR